MLNPTLYLAFINNDDAGKALKQHICLCRNEDILFPKGEILEFLEHDFDKLDGYELRFVRNEKSFLVGYNRFKENEPMFGWIQITGNPIQKPVYE